MYKLGAAGKYPLLAWLVQQPEAGAVRCVVIEPRGQQSGDARTSIALRSLVDRSVTSVQAKYAERAAAIEGNFRDSARREAAIEEVRNAFFEVVRGRDNSLELRDLWPQVEAQIHSEHPLEPTLEDAKHALQSYHSMRNYLTTKHASTATEHADDLYEVHEHINMTNVHTYSDAEYTYKKDRLVQLAKQTLVSGDQHAAFACARSPTTPPDFVELCAMAVRYSAPGSTVSGVPVSTWARSKTLNTDPGRSLSHALPSNRKRLCSSQTPSDIAPEFYEAVVPHGNLWCSLDTGQAKPHGDFNARVSSTWIVPDAVQDLVKPSLMVGIASETVTNGMITSISNALTSHTPFVGKSDEQTLFVELEQGVPPSMTGGWPAEAADVTAALDPPKKIHPSMLPLPPHDGPDHAKTGCSLQALFVASPRSKKQNAPPEYFRLTPTAVTVHDNVLEFDSSDSWCGGAGPSEACDAFEGIQAFLRHKISQ